VAAQRQTMATNLLTTDRAAQQLGISPSRLRFLIRAGRIAAERLGRDWVITPAALAAFERRPEGWQKGRPRSRPAE
jgi:excisionase family DNA binding protein